MKTKIAGAIPPMIVPFKENGDINYNDYISNLEKWNETEVSGYLVAGSNSEACLLTKEEKLELLKIAKENAKENKTIIMGSGAESTRETISLSNESAKLGANYALILNPFFFKGQMTNEALIKHYTEVANNVDIPILIYNVPKFTGLNIDSVVIEELCYNKNILGAKDSMGDIVQLGNYVDVAKSNGEILVGTAGLLYPAMELGIKAGILALANVAPKECSTIFNLYKQGCKAEAEALWKKMVPVNKAITADYGVPGLKYAMELVGMKGGYVRSPLLDLDKQDKLELEKILKAADLI